MPAAHTHDNVMNPAHKFTIVDVVQDLLTANDLTATHNRKHFDDHGVLAINLMSSPGSGKTALLEATILALKSRHRIAVIEGDLETENDAERIRACGVPALQITTGTACHLDASLVHRRAAPAAACGDRFVVHRKRRQSRLPGKLRFGAAPQCHAVERHGRR
jgi:hydrogenase accessory protein HypB